MWFRLTIARSRPASTRWCRNTEFRTARAGGPAPKDTFETPSEVLTPGALLNRVDPLDRRDRGRLPLVVARRQREGERVEDRRLAVEPVLVARDLRDPLRDLELALRRLRHPVSSIVSAISAAPCAFASGITRSRLLAPRLEVDRVDDRATGDRLERSLDHVGEHRSGRSGSVLVGSARCAGPPRASARPRPGAR